MIFPLWILGFLRSPKDYNFRQEDYHVASKYFLICCDGCSTAATAQRAQDFRALQLPVMQHRQFDDSLGRKLLEQTRRNTCYTMRSYFFRRQDGQAPVPAGMTTCTPASVSQQRQVSPRPSVKFVPLGAERRRPITNHQAAGHPSRAKDSGQQYAFPASFHTPLTLALYAERVWAALTERFLG